VSPTVTTTYSVTGTSSLGCISQVAIATITVANNLTVTISGNATVCSGSPLNLTAGGASTYTWNTGAVTSTIAHTPTANITYSVVGASGSCSNNAMFSVTVNPLPNLSVSSSTTMLCLGSSATLSANGGLSYTWNPGGTGSSIVVSPSVNTTYTLQGNNSSGCSNTSVFTQSVTNCTATGIMLSSSGGEIKIYPNPSQGKFTVEGPGGERNVEIYNSNGELVYRKGITGNKNEINIQELCNGIYFIILREESRVLKTGRIIKE
jgi:hypothetical protein